MDSRLEQALDISNHMITLNNQRRIIHEQFLENSIHYLNGGKFSVNRELINFCHTLMQNSQSQAVLIDDNNIPISIDNLEEFLTDLLDIYFKASYEYLDKYNEIKASRKVEGLVDL